MNSIFVYLATTITVDSYGLPDVSDEGGLADVSIRIMNAILTVIATLSVVMIIYGAILYITAAGNDERIEKGKKTLMWAILGVVFAVLSYSALNIITQSGLFGSINNPPAASSGQPVAAINIAASQTTVAPGGTLTFTASCTDASGAATDCGTVAWSAVSGTVSGGSYTAPGAEGTDTVTGTANGKSGTATVTITTSAPDTTVATLTLSPTTVELEPGGTQDFTATCANAAGDSVDCGAITWNADSGSFSGATYTASDSSGSATVTGTVNGKSASATVTITASQEFSLTVHGQGSREDNENTMTAQSGETKEVTIAGDTDASIVWESPEGSTPSLDCGGASTGNQASGSASLTVTTTTDCKLTVNSSEATVTILPGPIATISATPTSISSGSSFDVNWDGGNRAQSVSVLCAQGTNRIFQASNQSGSRNVRVMNTGMVTCTIDVSGLNGTAQDIVRVTVTP